MRMLRIPCLPPSTLVCFQSWSPIRRSRQLGRPPLPTTPRRSPPPSVCSGHGILSYKVAVSLRMVTQPFPARGRVLLCPPPPLPHRRRRRRRRRRNPPLHRRARSRLTLERASTNLPLHPGLPAELVRVSPLWARALRRQHGQLLGCAPSAPARPAPRPPRPTLHPARRARPS
jgi:hypothetical protein